MYYVRISLFMKQFLFFYDHADVLQLSFSAKKSSSSCIMMFTMHAFTRKKREPKHELAKKGNCFDLLSDSAVWFHLMHFYGSIFVFSLSLLLLSWYFWVIVLCVELPRSLYSSFSFSLSFQKSVMNRNVYVCPK